MAEIETASSSTLPEDEATESIGESEDTEDKTNLQDFSHPVFQKVSRFNGEVNRMKRAELKTRLLEYNLDVNGSVDVLKKRLKNAYRKGKLKEANMAIPTCTLDYIVVIDYEATCEADVQNYRHEIIEFPAILVNVTNGAIVDEFRSYCKPIENPKLTQFCKDLTGITQEDVDSAKEFPVVLRSFEEWLKSHRLGTRHGFKFAVATDGPWDMRRFLYYQCKMSDIVFPKWARKWVNLRTLFSNFYKKNGNIETMLSHLGLVFEGRQHSGLDDARNIVRIAQHLIRDGSRIEVNQSFSGNERGRIQEVKPQKIRTVVEPKPVNLKTEEEKKKDKEIREALKKLRLESDQAFVAFYKSVGRC